MRDEDRERALERLVYGVYVVGTSLGDVPHAFTASWACRVSGDPPLVLVAIRRSRSANEAIRRTGNFALSVLAERQEDVARRFSGEEPARRDPREDAALFARRPCGAPVVQGSIAFVECVLLDVLSVGGDHDLFVGSVTDAGVTSEASPLVLHLSGLPPYAG